MSVKVVCPKVRMQVAVWEKLMAYVQACPQEVGGLGTVERRPEGLVVTDVYLLEQKVTSSTTVLDRAAVARFVADRVRKGEDVGTLRLWWHSHAAMGVFWSSTDLDTIKDLAAGGWLLAIVGNRKGETKTRLALGGEVSLAVDGLEIEVFTEVSEEVRAAAEAEIKAKVKTSRWGRHGYSVPAGDATALSAEVEELASPFSEKP